MNRVRRFSQLTVILAAAFLLGSTARIGAQEDSLEFAGIEEQPEAQAALDVALRDEDGNAIMLSDLVNKPTILTLNYFRCAGICTPLLNGLVDTLNQIQLEPGKNFQVITISFDPTDTPEIAHQKRINYLEQIKRPFPPTAWRFLTGDGPSTKRVANSVGFRFRAEGDQFIHAAAIIVLTSEGKVSRYLYGITYLPADLQMAIQEAARGQSNPTIARVLTYCYSYDAARGTYVLDLTRIIGAGTLLVAGLFVIFVLRKRSGTRKKGKGTGQAV